MIAKGQIELQSQLLMTITQANRVCVLSIRDCFVVISAFVDFLRSWKGLRKKIKAERNRKLRTIDRQCQKPSNY